MGYQCKGVLIQILITLFQICLLNYFFGNHASYFFYFKIKHCFLTVYCKQSPKDVLTLKLNKIYDINNLVNQFIGLSDTWSPVRISG